MTSSSPRLVFLSGSLTPGSRTDRLGRWCARHCAGRGAAVDVFRGQDLEFPFYRPGESDRTERQRRYLHALAVADGVVLLSPAYHGAVSGLLKNALDYVNDLAGDPRPFLAERAVGCVAVAAGEQGASSTLQTLRTVCHSLRGWPTSLGVALCRERAEVGTDGAPQALGAREQLLTMLDQVLTLSTMCASRRPMQAGPVRVAS